MIFKTRLYKVEKRGISGVNSKYRLISIVIVELLNIEDKRKKVNDFLLLVRIVNSFSSAYEYSD